MKMLQQLNEMPTITWSQAEAIQYFIEMIEDWVADGMVEIEPGWKRVIKNIKFKKELAKLLSDSDSDNWGRHEEDAVEERYKVIHELLKKYKLGKWTGW